jgi:hypothetical protein
MDQSPGLWEYSLLFLITICIALGTVVLVFLGYIIFFSNNAIIPLYSKAQSLYPLEEPVTIFIQTETGGSTHGVYAAINTLSVYLDIEVTSNPNNADICVYVFDDLQLYDAKTGEVIMGRTVYSNNHKKTRWKNGCVGYSQVYLSSPANNTIVLAEHELIHALGYHQHSPNRQDVMYPSLNSSQSQLTAQDIAVIRSMYP